MGSFHSNWAFAMIANLYFDMLTTEQPGQVSDFNAARLAGTPKRFG